MVGPMRQNSSGEVWQVTRTTTFAVMAQYNHLGTFVMHDICTILGANEPPPELESP